MGIWQSLKGRPKVEGEIGFFGLADWWLSTFTAAERSYIESVYHPFGISTSDENGHSLTRGQIGWSSGTACKLLSDLGSWLQKPEDLHIARRIFAKAELLAERNGEVLDLHFTYHAMIQVFYKNKDFDQVGMSEAIAACEKQIALSQKASEAFRKEFPDRHLPEHQGFNYLVMIHEIQKNYSEAIRVAKVAMGEGWGGDWGNWIGRLTEKANKPKKKGGKKDGP